MKFLIWLVIVFILVNWFLRQKKTIQPNNSTARAAADPQALAAEPMLPCRQCGLHVPASEAIVHASGAVFCCDEHRRRTFPS